MIFEQSYKNTANMKEYLLLIKELRTMRESSIRETISLVVSPRNNSSPRFLKLPNVNSWLFQSAITCFSLASISFSLTAEIQMSWNDVLNTSNIAQQKKQKIQGCQTKLGDDFQIAVISLVGNVTQLGNNQSDSSILRQISKLSVSTSEHQLLNEAFLTYNKLTEKIFLHYHWRNKSVIKQLQVH